MSGAETGVVEIIKEEDGTAALEAYNNDGQKEVETLIGKTLADFYEWFDQNYSENAHKNDITTVTQEQSSVTISTTDVRS